MSIDRVRHETGRQREHCDVAERSERVEIHLDVSIGVGRISVNLEPPRNVTESNSELLVEINERNTHPVGQCETYGGLARTSWAN
jgi:hypothetical protein